MKRTIISVVAGLILLIITYFLSGLIMSSGDKIVAKAVSAEENVKVTSVKNSTNDATLNLNSIVQSENKLQLISEVTGIIDFTNIRFKKGQKFKKGQTIIKINSDEAEAFLRQSRSQFQNQIASVLADIKIDYPESYEKWEEYFLNYDIESDIAELPKQSTNNETFFLTGRGIISSYYGVKSSEERLNKYNIVAPFDGVVSSSFVENGTMARAGLVLGEFINSDSFEIEVDIPSEYKSYIIKDKEVYIKLSDGTSINGKINRINNNVNRETQTVSVFVKSNSKKLSDGMYVDLILSLKSFDNSFKISRSMIKNDSIVHTVKSMAVKNKIVNPEFYGDNYAIVTGLDDGDLVIQTQIPEIFEGMKVKIMD
ncbi:MAG: efflux RND transporter periplasmic adaptor subunit [Flavobacteriaceae bacterium]